MAEISLLNRRSFKINNDISVYIPTVGELREIVSDTEGTVYPIYLLMVNLFLATSCDIMVELDEQGIDFTKWSDYSTFLTMLNIMNKDMLREYSHLLITGCNLADFRMTPSPDGQHVLLQNQDGVTINEAVYMQMSSTYSAITCIKKNRRKMGNETMKQYAVERAKAHRRNNAKRIKRSIESVFDKEIIALVNNANFKYDFRTVNDLTLYDFNVSRKQIVKKYNIDNTYTGIYAGTVKIEHNDNNKLNWLDYDG